MKKLIVPLALLLLAACGQKAPKAQEEAQEEKPKGPIAQIEFPEGTEYNFGTYYEREDKTHDFLGVLIGQICPCGVVVFAILAFVGWE